MKSKSLSLQGAVTQSSASITLGENVKPHHLGHKVQDCLAEISTASKTVAKSAAQQSQITLTPASPQWSHTE